MKISPTSPDSASVPSARTTFISPLSGRPTEPRCSNHSVPLMSVDACASVPAYSSQIVCGPSQSIHASLSHGGHGAPRCHTTVNDDTSYRARTAGGSFEMRAIIVGTTYMHSGRCSSISCSVRSASNLPPSTTWLPASRPVTDHMNGPLWYSGPGITIVPSGIIRSRGLASGSISAGAVLRINFGRPVLPPEVIPFHGSDTASTRGSAAGADAGVQPRGKHVDPG